MLRDSLMRNHADQDFRWRGGEIARIEGLSDAVFAFAVTLLVVSLEVPKTFNELAVLMRGFVSFAICFGLLIQVWYEQFLFFRRYNLQDKGTLWLNAFLLFVVLFYVYPLKFLFSFLVKVWMGMETRVQLPGGVFENAIEFNQMPQLMAIYGAGYLAVSCVFMLLFYRALRRREELQLNELETFDTRVSIGASMINASAVAVSLCIALSGIDRLGGISRMIYPILLGPEFGIYYTVVGRRRRKRFG